jgi:uncharacterized protein
MITGPLPTSIDHRKFALGNRKLAGDLSLSQFDRFVQYLESETSVVQCKLEFRKGKKQKSLIIGRATTTVRLVCQNCLQEMDFDLDISFRHFIVADDEELLDLPDGVEGIICAGDKISSVDIFEDELILNLPMVARHEDNECQMAFEHQNDDSSIETGTYKPFAGLAELKNKLKRS